MSANQLPPDVLESIKAVFFQECDELIAELEANLTRMETGEADAETINAAFRAAHSIKGSAGTFGFDQLVAFAHDFETALDRIRAREVAAHLDVVKSLLRATDILADLIACAREDRTTEPAESQAVLAELRLIALTQSNEADVLDGFDFTPVPVVLDIAPSAPETLWNVQIVPKDTGSGRVNQPVIEAILGDLGWLGGARTDWPASAEDADGRWSTQLRTCATEADIRAALQSVEDNYGVTLALAAEPVGMGAADSAPDVEWFVDPDSFGRPPTTSQDDQPALRQAVPTAAPAVATIRVDPARIDQLIDLAGELIINQAMLSQSLLKQGAHRIAPVRNALEDLEQLTREMQGQVMAIRAQSVAGVFQRMSRLVRETSVQTGKSVRLVTEGEGVEVDRTIIERLTDPLTHMIRNAVDHGIESAELRASRGKPAEGRINLSARHKSGQLLIEVSDDGGGIDRARVRQIAVRKGLIDPQADIADAEIDNLIFTPGFSTAEAVTDISGRGVGLDVVRAGIQSLGGRIAVASEPGQGSKVTLSLPLTLAVLDGMITQVAGQVMVVPLAAILQMLRPKPSAVTTLGPGATLLSIGDEHLPVIDVAVALGWRTEAIDPAAGVVLIVEVGASRRGCLVVDSIVEQRQVVIKSIAAHYQRVDGVAAATILGDGRVALILDVDAVLEDAGSHEIERRLAVGGVR